jgi:hypothetical protein
MARGRRLGMKGIHVKLSDEGVTKASEAGFGSQSS